MLACILSRKVRTCDHVQPRTTPQLPARSADLHHIREFLIHALGPDFTRSSLENRDGYVSSRVSNVVLHTSIHTSCQSRSSEPLPRPHLPPPDLIITCTASHAPITSTGSPTYLQNRSMYLPCIFAVERILIHVPRRVNALSPIVDPEIVSVVDLSNLRALCSHGESGLRGIVEHGSSSLNRLQGCRHIPRGCDRAYGGKVVFMSAHT